jgi:hypothetical protein
MNCEQYQRRLLGTESPDRPAPEVEAHLVRCAACREWQGRLLQLEANVPLLPVPPSAGGFRLARRILASKTPLPRSIPLSRRRWRWLAGGAAAATVLIACGILLGNALWQAVEKPVDRPRAEGSWEKERPVQPRPADRKQAARQDRLVACLVRCDLRLARAGSPQERVEALAELADSLHGESAGLVRSAPSRELDQLASLYGKVVRQEVGTAREIPTRLRRQVLGPIALRLARAEREARELAEQTPGSAGPLLQIAAVAREGRARLHDLIEKET